MVSGERQTGGRKLVEVRYVILERFHADIQQRLETARQTFGHPGTKGDASQGVWLEMLSAYLPKRYEATSAHVVDSNGNFSDQIDVVIFDRQYSPFIFNFQQQKIVPAESVYGVFEAKQSINLNEVRYAQDNVLRAPDNQAAKRYPAAKQSTSKIPAVSRETRKEAKRALKPSIAPNLPPLRVSLPAHSDSYS